MAIVITGTSITAPDGAIDAADLTGTLPAIDGSGLTGIEAGGLKLISHTDITADAAYINYTFDAGYRGFIINANSFKATGGNWTVLWARLTDDTDALISTGEYNFVRGDGGNNTSNQNQINPGISQISEENQDTSPSYTLTIMNPLSETIPTSYTFFGGGLAKSTTSTYSAASILAGGMSIPEVNTSVRIYPQSGSIASTSDSFTVWGIK